MAKKSVTYLFTRDEKSIAGFLSKNCAATDAVGVVHLWGIEKGRSVTILLDRNDAFIACLTYEDEREQEAADDLNKRCSDRGLKREFLTKEQSDQYLL